MELQSAVLKIQKSNERFFLSLPKDRFKANKYCFDKIKIKINFELLNIIEIWI